MEKCLTECQKHHPDVIFNGGDMVMDCLGVDEDRVKPQWDIFTHVLRANAGVQVHHCIGNHDVWGWADIAKYKNESKFGKRYAMDRLGLDRRYRSFDLNGWHIVILDSTHRRFGNGYTARLDEEQFEWLVDDLARVPANRPVLVMSHIPIISACSIFHGANEASGQWRVPTGWSHIDARRIKDLFKKHPNVTACVAGHMHLVDRVDYLGVSYFCNGAACGGWWRGPFQECRNGYGILDLYSDGTVENEYHEYSWTPRA